MVMGKCKTVCRVEAVQASACIGIPAHGTSCTQMGRWDKKREVCELEWSGI